MNHTFRDYPASFYIKQKSHTKMHLIGSLDMCRWWVLFHVSDDVFANLPNVLVIPMGGQVEVGSRQGRNVVPVLFCRVVCGLTCGLGAVLVHS